MIVKKIRQSEVELIHEKTLELLEEVGVIFEHPDLIDYFKRLGIRTDGFRVFFDRATVERALSTMPASFVMRNPYEQVKIGEGGRAISTSSGARKMLKNGQLVDPTLEDYIKIRKLDATSPVVNISSFSQVYVPELPADRDRLIKVALTLLHSKHPLQSSCMKKKDAEETIELIRRFYGMDSGYCAVGMGSVISPLRYDRNDIEAILSYAVRGLPAGVNCCSMPGMTSPITVGGTVLVNNAEILAGLVMIQLVKPGNPVVYGNVSFGSNMRYAVPVSWGPEVALIIQYASAMAHYYKVPCRIGGSMSAAKQLDWQDGAQAAMSIMTTLDCECDFFFHACGELDSFNVFSLEKYILDEELVRQRLNLHDREYITEDDLCLESIREVGAGGNFLLEDDTLDRYDTEFYLSDLFSCENYVRWEGRGRPDVLDKAAKMVEKRLEEYQAPEYTPEQMAILDEVLKF